MHPAQQTHPFAPDGWFPVELSQHVPEGLVVQSMLLGQELALWRSAAGSVQAWENRCPHRSVRLTLGFVVDDQLVCRYHGWRYGRDGRCTSVPSTPTLAPPPTACVRTYMCRESDGVVWASLARAPRAYPPRVPGLVACRSFTLDGAFEVVTNTVETAGFAPAGEPTVWCEAAGKTDVATLLLQPMDACTTGVHLFISETLATAHRIAAAGRIKALFAKEPCHV
ncbi:MAG: (2Fe-2S)-binding protein [Burkholderiales bacterium]|nr:MAG: (2Fe-2S)-binding protein [Burkholderiales bacterium]